MATNDGKIAQCGGVIYEFNSEEDAASFVNCCNSLGGRPGLCAVEWRCIIKKMEIIEKDVGLAG